MQEDNLKNETANNDKGDVSRSLKAYCEMYKSELATVEITYGLYSEYQKGRPHYNHKLCGKAAKELWDKCAILVNQGDMHWTKKPLQFGTILSDYTEV